MQVPKVLKIWDVRKYVFGHSLLLHKDTNLIKDYSSEIINGTWNYDHNVYVVIIKTALINKEIKN